MANAKLDWLAHHIIAVFEDGDFDAYYIDGIKEKLAGRDRLDVLRWCNNLDGARKEDLSQRLNINTADLRATLRVLQRI